MPFRTSYSSGYRTTTTDANRSRAHPCTEQNFTLLHGVDPYTYLVDVLQRISEHPAKRVRELTPRRWKSLFAHDPLPSALGHHNHDPPSH